MNPLFLRVVQLTWLVILQAVALFLSAGTLRWSAGWWYVLFYVLMLVVGSILLFPAHKAVIEERSKGARGGKHWDFWLTKLLTLPSFGLLVVSGLDERFGWTPALPASLRLFGALLFIAGFGLVLWAMRANPFFAQIVRIQTERGHTAITSGPYRLVRHPGYLGMTISISGAAFLLDSRYALFCILLYVILIVLRTSLEDRTLQVELPGYREFAAHTRYRLFPGIW